MCCKRVCKRAGDCDRRFFADKKNREFGAELKHNQQRYPHDKCRAGKPVSGSTLMHNLSFQSTVLKENQQEENAQCTARPLRLAACCCLQVFSLILQADRDREQRGRAALI